MSSLNRAKRPIRTPGAVFPRLQGKTSPSGTLWCQADRHYYGEQMYRVIRETDTKWFMSCGQRDMSEEAKEMRSGLKSVSLSPLRVMVMSEPVLLLGPTSGFRVWSSHRLY